MTSPPEVTLSGAFDDLRFRDVRSLEEASRRGPVHVRVAADADLPTPPRFPEQERIYFLRSLRWVSRVTLLGSGAAHARGSDWDPATGRPLPEHTSGTTLIEPSPVARSTVLVSGCYDWLHTGHVRFFEEASEVGSLHVTVGSDASVRAFKGPGHPMQSQDERCYMVGSVRHVTEASVASGEGWLDWAPDAERLRPDVFVVNEDGDRPEKRAYCEAHGISYRVFARRPRAGLPPRSSTELRGF